MLRTRYRARGGSGGTSFTPTDISGLALWLDAADAATITQAAGAVSQWDDKSTESNHFTQPTGANQPTTASRTVNGRNALDFIANDFMIGPAGLYNINQVNNTFFAVFGQDTTGNISFFDGKQAAFSNRIYGLRIDATGTRFSFINGNYGNDALLIRTYDANPHIHVGRRSALGANGVQFYHDGTVAATLGFGAANSALDSIIMGKNLGGSFDFMDGPVCEVLIYRGTITDAQINTIGTYLAAKWGITWTNI